MTSRLKVLYSSLMNIIAAEQPDVASSLANALNKVHGGAIYLLHAESTTNASMLADFIDGCRAKGFEFGYYSKVD